MHIDMTDSPLDLVLHIGGPSPAVCPVPQRTVSIELDVDGRDQLTWPSVSVASSIDQKTISNLFRFDVYEIGSQQLSALWMIL